jgi:hypothetical protein
MSESVTDALLETLCGVSPLVAELLILRREQGRERYGTELTTWNGRDPDVDLLQERVDSLLYAMQGQIERPSDERAEAVIRLMAEVDGLAHELADR